MLLLHVIPQVLLSVRILYSKLKIILDSSEDEETVCRESPVSAMSYFFGEPLPKSIGLLHTYFRAYSKSPCLQERRGRYFN